MSKHPSKSVAIYARVSTDKQKVDMQLNELRQFAARSGWRIHREYIDQSFTGANTNRPAFSEMMDEARKRKFNVLLVWKLDRLSRSLKDLINTLDELGSLGIDFVSYDNNLDTSTPTGKLVFQIVGAVAEFEKDIIKERVIAGLANARRKGKRLGRPPVDADLYARAKELRLQGLSFRKIAQGLKIDEGTIRKRLKREAEKRKRLKSHITPKENIMPNIPTLSGTTNFDYTPDGNGGFYLEYKGRPHITAQLIANIQAVFAGQNVVGGFNMTNPIPGGFGDWIQQNTQFTPRHASHIAAVLLRMGIIKGAVNGRPITLQF
jgi:DNA invertase Pin-like site-specific DNA recombinase